MKEIDHLRFMKWLVENRKTDDIYIDNNMEILPSMKMNEEVMSSAQIEYRVLICFNERPRFSKVALEAGHIYVDPSQSPLGSEDRDIALSGAALGARIHDLLSRKMQVSRWVFVDDLHVNGGVKQDPDKAVKEYGRYGFKPDVAVMESDPKLNSEALGLVDKIREHSPDRLVTMRKGFSLRAADPDAQNILLADRTKQKEPINPKCSALDAALTLQKIQHLGEDSAVINVLPQIYIPQQVNTREILAAAGYEDLFIMSVFYNTAPPAYSMSGNFPARR